MPSSKAVLYTFVRLCSLIVGAVATAKGRPNIVFILTDDQDTHMNSLEHMPLTQKYLINEGAVFHRHYCTVAICCPSRVNIWTGQLAHNTNVTDVIPPYGGYPKFVSRGYNDNFLPLWMQQAGYNTYYSGKLFNAHTTDNYNNPAVRGFNGSEFILDPFTYQYYNVSLTRNGEAPVNYAGQYSPDVTAEKAYGFLEEALSHQNKMKAGPPQAAARHAHLFKDYKIPRTKNFNPEKASGVSWVAKLPRLNDTVIEYNDEYQRQRLRALQAVDEMVEQIVLRLQDAGVLENTYIFYSSDNGYHISQHRMHPGKECGFETDINVPLVVRGPGISAGSQRWDVSSHTDLAPTFMTIAGNELRDDFDGQPMELRESDPNRPEHLNIEFWGLGVPEGKYGYKGKYGYGDGIGNAYANNTYKGLRIIGEDYSVYYSVWCTNERELYDMKADPDQLNNLLGGDEFLSSSPSTKILGYPLHQVVSRLDALMMVLKSCKAKTCTDPWAVIHPQGDVRSLRDALHVDFDAFYHEQQKESFSRCELGYILDAEGPQDVTVFGYEGAGGFLRKQHALISPTWSLMA